MSSSSTSLAALAALLAAPLASAHIGYGGRDFGTLVPGAAPITINTQTASSAFGWADATDADWGDSHRGRFFRFTLTQTASVTFTAQRADRGTGAFNTFLPAFSVFAGLGHLAPNQGSHDSAALSVASRPGGTEGSFRALTDWSIGNDPTYTVSGDPGSGILIEPSLRFFTHIGHAADGTSANFGTAPGILGDGLADGTVTTTLIDLLPGDYSIFVGGANYDAQFLDAEDGPTFLTYGVDLTVQAIPEPGTVGALLGTAALLAAAAFRRSRRS